MLWLLTQYSGISYYRLENCCFNTYVDSIIASKLEIKDTKKYAPSVSYLDILLKRDTDGNLTTKLKDKLDDFNFQIVSFSYLMSNILSSSGYLVFSPSLFNM